MKKKSGIILLALIVVYLLVNMASVITYPNDRSVSVDQHGLRHHIPQ